MEIEVVTSMLSADLSNLEKEVKSVEKEGADGIHWDIMDDHFVPNIGLSPRCIQSLREKTDLPFYTHLMIENPEGYIERLAEFGNDILFFHAEVCDDFEEIISKIKDFDMKAGIVLNPETSLRLIDDVIDALDYILIMTVDPGFGNQELITDSLQKIRKARETVESRELDVNIAADGGVNDETAPEVVKAGANILIMGSVIYEDKREFSIRDLKERLNNL